MTAALIGLSAALTAAGVCIALVCALLRGDPDLTQAERRRVLFAGCGGLLVLMLAACGVLSVAVARLAG